VVSDEVKEVTVLIILLYYILFLFGDPANAEIIFALHKNYMIKFNKAGYAANPRIYYCFQIFPIELHNTGGRWRMWPSRGQWE
jgi:hypothetical protein